MKPPPNNSLKSDTVSGLWPATAPLSSNVRAMNIPENLGIPDYEFRLVFGTTKIEYDHAKEERNRKDHFYSLESAVDLLNNLISPLGAKRPHMIKGPFLEHGEVRHMHISVDDGGNAVVMVTTMRPEETVRVISFRRASPEEREEFRALTSFSG